MCKRSYIIFLILFVCLKSGQAQHYQFSQFYAAPMYLNPAFSGADVCSRLTINHRSQWTGIPGAFTSSQASFDHYFRSIKGGLGLQFFKDQAGLGALTTTQFSALYAYQARLSKKIMARAGFSAGSVQRSVNTSALTFGDQIENGESGATAESFGMLGTRYFDIGAGLLVYSQSWWAGLASSHFNKPNQSLMNAISPLPAETRLHAGYKLTIESFEGTRSKFSDHFVTVAANYKKQGKFNQIDVGVYYNKNLFVTGIWYRGIPLFRPKASFENNDAVIFLVGLAIQRFKVGYSYDLTISSLSNAISKGANEISMTYQFCQPKIKGKKKKSLLISCPKF